MKELKVSATQAASRFLSRRGYDILATSWKSKAGTADIVERRDAAERTERELVALAYLAEYDVVDVPVRFDDIGMVAIAPDRAMIRHHINSMCEELSDRALPEAA